MAAKKIAERVRPGMAQKNGEAWIYVDLCLLQMFKSCAKCSSMREVQLTFWRFLFRFHIDTVLIQGPSAMLCPHMVTSFGEVLETSLRMQRWLKLGLSI